MQRAGQVVLCWEMMRVVVEAGRQERELESRVEERGETERRRIGQVLLQPPVTEPELKTSLGWTARVQQPLLAGAVAPLIVGRRRTADVIAEGAFELAGGGVS